MPSRNVSERRRLRLVKLSLGYSQQWHTFSSPCALGVSADESAQTARKEDWCFTPSLPEGGGPVTVPLRRLHKEQRAHECDWASKTFNQWWKNSWSLPEDSFWTTQLSYALLTSQRASIVSLFFALFLLVLMCCSFQLWPISGIKLFLQLQPWLQQMAKRGR